MDKKNSRILVIGDIHGCATALKTLLNEVQPTPDDLVITLGDYVDRGPASYEVLEILIHLYKQGVLVPLRGNHEMLLLLNCRKCGSQAWRESKQHTDIQRQLCTDAQATNLELRLGKIKMAPLTPLWQNCGSETTIRSYRLANHNGRAIIPNHHFHFFDRDCVDWYELDDFIFVHGGVLSSESIEKTDIQDLHWKRTDPFTEPRHCSGKIIVCGHSVQGNGVPSLGANALCLDTGACCGGWLSCLDLNSGKCWQANEQGKIRKHNYGPLS